jgi:hypothetical protein
LRGNNQRNVLNSGIQVQYLDLLIMWLLIDLQENAYKAYFSFNRLKKDIGLAKSVDKPSINLRIGSKWEIREIEVDGGI